MSGLTPCQPKTVFLYVWSSHIARVWINRVNLPILLVVSWKGKVNISLSLFAPENLGSRDVFGRPVPRQCAHFHTQVESGAYFPRRRPFIYLKCHTPSGQSRVYRVTPLLTDGVHCRKFAGTGPANLKVVPVTGVALAGHHGSINMRLFIAMKWAC